MNIRNLSAICLLGAGLLGGLSGAEPAGNDERMRATLRDLTLQLRTAQGDLATAQAAQAAAVAANKDLSDKYEALKKQTMGERATTDHTITNLSAQLNELKAQAAKLAAALELARGDGAKAVQAAHAAEQANTKLAGEMSDLQHHLTDVQQKNLALYLIGNEILTRYEEFSLGNALRAKEPFVGLTRTKLENLVQDYQDKLADQRAK